MPVLKTPSFVQFDPSNPEHVKSVLEIATQSKRTHKFNFDFPAEFQNGVHYAKHMMFLAWGEHMARLHPEIIDVQTQATTMAAIDSGSSNIREFPVIGLRAKPLQENANRTLPPGSTIQ